MSRKDKDPKPPGTPEEKGNPNPDSPAQDPPSDPIPPAPETMQNPTDDQPPVIHPEDPPPTVEEGLIPLIAPLGATNATVSRAYSPHDGLFWVLPEDVAILVERHGFTQA